MHIRATLVGLVLAAGFPVMVASPASAQVAGVRVSGTGQEALRLAPSERASAPFRVRGAGLGEVRLQVSVPAGWRAITPPPLRLPADSSVLRVVSFFVPADAPAGTYAVQLRAFAGAAVVSVDSVLVHVHEHAALDVSVEHAPSWVSPDDTIAVGFRVTNRGNTPLTVDLRLLASAGLRADADAAPRRLAPGASWLVEVAAKTLSTHRTGQAHVLRLSATTAQDTVSGTAAARIEVIGEGVVSGRAVGHGMPAEVRFRVSDDERVRPSLRISAAGPIRAGGDTRADLLLQGPYTRYSIYGDQDIYRFSLQSGSYSLRLGDQVYGMSPLTEGGIPGQGVAGSVRAGPAEAGAYVQRDRRSASPAMQVGAHARTRLGSAATLGINVLHDEDALAPDRDVASARGTLGTPGGRLFADVEYGTRLGRPADALSVQLRSTAGPIAVQARHLRADSAYGGAYGGTSLDAVQVRARPLGRLVLEAAGEVRSTARVLAGRSFYESARTARLSAGLGATWAEGRYYEIGRASPWSVSERTVRSLAVRTRLAMGPLSFSPRMEWGHATDALTAGTTSFWRGGAQASLATQSGNYGAAAEYFSAGSAYTGTTPAGMNASLSASVRPFALTRVTAAASATRYTGSPNFASLLGSATLERELPFGHVAALRVSMRETMAGRGETLVMLDYTIPLRVPLGGSVETGSVHGRVFEQETGRPLAKVIVEVGGRRAATDESGRFEIRGLAVGPHRVRVDRGTAGIDRVPAEMLPAQVEVRGDDPAKLEIGMALTAVLEGIVVIVRQSAAATAVAATAAAYTRMQGEPEPLAGALVELSRGGERLRRTVDERGRFTVSDLRPGIWAVTVVGARLPRHYLFDGDTILVDAAPGGRVTVAFRAAPAERRVQMVASTAVSDAGGPSDATVQPARSVAVAARLEPHTVLPPEPETLRMPAPSTATRPAPRGPANEALPPGWRLHTSPRWVSTLTSAARAEYDDAGLWPRIWLANRSIVPNPERVPAGTVLHIPPMSPLSDAETQALHQYLQRGGCALAAYSPRPASAISSGSRRDRLNGTRAPLVSTISCLLR